MGKIDQSTVFVVSGGAKGITARCVVELAKHYRSKFILMGRSALKDSEPVWASGIHDEAELKKRAIADLQGRGEKPTPALVNRALNTVYSQREIVETLDEIKRAGGEAFYVSADITDAHAVKSALDSAKHLGTISGIIHGAGNLADKLIENKTEADFENVYAAKVQGLENLLAAVSADQLAYLVLFSSVAGFYGNVGQADYAIANEILNKTAHRFQTLHPSCRVVSINWGPWDGGMVTQQLRDYFDKLNIKIIPVDVGTRMLIDELEASGNGAATQVVIGSAISAPPTAPTPELKTYQIKRTLTLRDNPFLGDHVVDGKAVLPMVSAMSWMSSTAEQVYRGYRYFGFDNYKVLKGIIFDETLAESYTLELKEVSKSSEEIIVDAMIRSEQGGKPRFHYSARLTLRDQIPAPPTHTPPHDPDADTTPIAGETLYENGTLFHRYSFRGVQEVNRISRSGLTMRCSLQPIDLTYQGQFPIQAFNYFMADIGLQSIGIYARHFHDAGSLPLRAMHGRHYMNVEFGQTFYVNMRVLSSNATDIAAEITLYDEHGRVYFIVTDIAVTMSKNLNAMFLKNQLPENTFQ
jgi:NAD(P)-dependent dehydrogenase (short-subunit alcohol dehydrogenase family)